MSRSFQPIQYSINNQEEMHNRSDHRLFDDETPEETDQERPSSFEEDAREPLLNTEVQTFCDYCFAIGIAWGFM